MIDGARPLAILTEESEHQLTVLRRGLKRAAGFALYVVVAKDLGRAEALRRLRAWSGLSGVPELHFFPEGEAGARAVDLLLAARDEAHALAGAVLPDTEALIDVEEGNALASLNVARDVLGEVIRGPLLLLVSPEREGDLARRAPDLFDVRAGTVTVEARPVEIPELLQLFAATIASKEGPPRSVAELQAKAALLRTLAASEERPLGALVDAWVKLGREFIERDESGEAREIAKAVQQLAEGEGYTSGVADALALEARALERIGDLDEAFVRYEQALALQEKLGDRQALAVTYNQLGTIALLRDRLSDARSFYEKSLSMSEELHSRPMVALTCLQLAGVALSGGEIDEAQTWCERSLAIHHELGVRSEELALTYHQLAIVEQARGEPDKADAWYKKALAVRQELDNRPSEASSYRSLGGAAKARGELDEAQAWYERSLAIQEELGDRREMCAIYRQLGEVAKARGELDEAQAWHEKSISTAEELGDRPSVAASYHGLGAVAEARGELDTAEGWYKKSLALDEEFRNRLGMARTYQQLSAIAQARGEFEEAQSLSEKVLAIHNELGNRQGMAVSYQWLGALAIARGKLDEAQALSEKALAIHEDLGSRQGVAMSYAVLGTIAAARVDPAQALDWTTRAAALLPQFPHSMASGVADQLAILTSALGMPALEASWQRTTGKPLPAQVRSYVEDHTPRTERKD